MCCLVIYVCYTCVASLTMCVYICVVLLSICVIYVLSRYLCMLYMCCLVIYVCYICVVSLFMCVIYLLSRYLRVLYMCCLVIYVCYICVVSLFMCVIYFVIPLSTCVIYWAVLGPLLFLIYINDLHLSIHYSTTRLLADDTNLLIKK